MQDAAGHQSIGTLLCGCLHTPVLWALLCRRACRSPQLCLLALLGHLCKLAASCPCPQATALSFRSSCLPSILPCQLSDCCFSIWSMSCLSCLPFLLVKLCLSLCWIAALYPPIRLQHILHQPGSHTSSLHFMLMMCCHLVLPFHAFDACTACCAWSCSPCSDASCIVLTGAVCADMQLNLALVGLLNVSLALEDPFDNQGLDGIYVDEALFEAEQVCLALPTPT